MSTTRPPGRRRSLNDCVGAELRPGDGRRSARTYPTRRARLVRAVTEAGFQVLAVPGPSAVTASVGLSGLVRRSVHVPRISATQGHVSGPGGWSCARILPITVVAFEAPGRVATLLSDWKDPRAGRPSVLRLPGDHQAARRVPTGNGRIPRGLLPVERGARRSHARPRRIVRRRCFDR